ncbi:hypothetical protein [Thiohalorhabdus sp.]|uniref:hypothetical protein n=1 Tax=Thiohalorhabdus sp. TaxID=3094134 RepID=UPI002FC2EC96
MSSTRSARLATRCVHAGEADEAHGSPHTPLYTTTFGFPDTGAVLDAVEGRSIASLYTGKGMNPTIRALETKLASREEAEGAALVFVETPTNPALWEEFILADRLRRHSGPGWDEQGPHHCWKTAAWLPPEAAQHGRVLA